MITSNSRDEILSRIKRAENTATPGLPIIRRTSYPDVVAKFSEVLTAIGGAVIPVRSHSGIEEYVYQNFDPEQRIISVIPSMNQKGVSRSSLLHPLDNLEVAVIKAHFGVAENGAVWITDDQLSDRLLPFICQHLIVILDADSLVPTMHEAYDWIGESDYDFGTFIAGPSKTADIEQSLVLGAHGPKTMTVLLLRSE